MKKKGMVSIVTIAVFACLLLCTPVSAQGNPGAGCHMTTKYYDTIHGGIYFEQYGWMQFGSMTKTFSDVPDGIKIARVYTGVWAGSPGKGGDFNITVNGATSPTYQACDPCPDATNCEPYQPLRCNTVNTSECHDYVTGCNVHFISYNATSYIVPGSNTVTVKAVGNESCPRGGWDGRIYLIALLVVYEDTNMPEITYWINEGAPYMEKGSYCDGFKDHLDISFYFNGTHISNPATLKYWTLGFPRAANASAEPAYTKLNGNNIGEYDYMEMYGGYEIFYRWDNIPASYLNPSSNLFCYHNPDPFYERVNVAVLTLEKEVAEKPDLLITTINAYHYNPGSQAWFNLSNEVDVTIKNNGTADAEAFNVGLSAGDDLIGKKTVSGLGVGEMRTMQFKWTPIGEDCFENCTFTDTYQDYELRAVADCDNDVDEGDETNNDLTELERACYNGYMADEPLENVAHGTLHGGMLFTTGDGTYGGLYSVGDSMDTHYEITIPAGATVKLARLNVYYTWHYKKTSCPAMEVSITYGGNTHVLPVEKKYSDIKCWEPWNFPWGNYVFNLTDHIQGSGTYTVTVKRTGGPSFCIAAPGIEVVYQDETKPLIEYWIAEGADILIGGRRGDGGFLDLEECVNNATFEGDINLIKVKNATLGVVSPWAGAGWTPGMTNYLYFNGVELGRGVYHGYDETYSETIDGITMDVGRCPEGESPNAQIGVNVTDVTGYLQASDNRVGQGDDGDNMMPCNAFLVVEYEPSSIEVNKTVWNPVNETWVKEIDAKLNDTLRFRCEVHNSGDFNLTNITVVDILSDSLEYDDNATPREPDWTSSNKFGWNFTSLEPYETIVIEFSATVVDYGKDTNLQNATAWCEEIGTWVSAEDSVSITMPRPGICGDVNEDGIINMDDVMTLWYDYADYPYPGAYTISNEWAADVTGDDVINMDDVMTLWYDYADYPYPGAYEVNCKPF